MILKAPGFEENITEAVHCYELAIEVTCVLHLMITTFAFDRSLTFPDLHDLQTHGVCCDAVHGARQCSSGEPSISHVMNTCVFMLSRCLAALKTLFGTLIKQLRFSTRYTPRGSPAGPRPLIKRSL